jgi:hypothetical protein
MSDPIVFQAGGCPICGGDVMADESMEGGSFTDGEYAFCASNCGWFGSVSVVEDDGEAFPSTASELEPIIERLEEANDQASKLHDLLTRLRANHPDAGQPNYSGVRQMMSGPQTSALWREVDAALGLASNSSVTSDPSNTSIASKRPNTEECK